MRASPQWNEKTYPSNLETVMFSRKRISGFLILLLLFAGSETAFAQSRLEGAFAELYATCLFDVPTVENNPFSQAASLARETFAPGLSGFIESNLAAIPLAPPGLEAEYVEGEVVNVVTGFAPVYTESSATIGEGTFLVGANTSHFTLSQIRGQNLSDLQFEFQQNGGGDTVFVTMPFDINATVFTLHGGYGVSNRFDVGFALPVVRLSVDNVNTSFRVEGGNTGCRYIPGDLNCEGRGSRSISPALFALVDDQSETETLVGTLALRAKYRFPVSVTGGHLAAVLEVRLPTRKESSILGRGNFGTRLSFIGEYQELGTFKPYVNVGGQFWNGRNSNSLKVATGFNQQLASRLFLAFDLLGEIDLEPDPFLGAIDNPVVDEAYTSESVLTQSGIPALGRDHTLNAGLGLQWALAPRVHAYGSALFSLLDRGLQSTVAPTVGVAAHF